MKLGLWLGISVVIGAVWVRAEAAPAPVAFFSSEAEVARPSPFDGPPAVLLLAKPLRDDLREVWRDRDPETIAGRRLKCLLLEDGGEFAAAEQLAEFPADRLRLIWRQGRIAEAGEMWERLSDWGPDPLPQSKQSWIFNGENTIREAWLAMLPLVAMGTDKDVTAFRDFLLRDLGDREVARLFWHCQPHGVWWDRPGVQVAWLQARAKGFPKASGKVPELLRLGVGVAAGELDGGEVLRVLEIMESGGMAGERRILRDAMAATKSMNPRLWKVALAGLLATHPEEGVELAVRSDGRAWERAPELGSPLLIQALRERVDEVPEDREARFALARALRALGASTREVIEVWETAAASVDKVPTDVLMEPLNSFSGSFEAEVLHFGAREIPERTRAKFHERWVRERQAEPLDAAMMAAWLALPDAFWNEWDEGVKAAPESMLGAVASRRVGGVKWEDARRVREVYRACLDEGWSGSLVGSLEVVGVKDLPRPTRGLPQEASVERPAGVDFATAGELRTLYDGMVAALCWETPFRQWSFTAHPKPGPQAAGIPPTGFRSISVGRNQMIPSTIYDWSGNRPPVVKVAVEVPSLDPIDLERLSVGGREVLDFVVSELTSPLDRDAALQRARRWWRETSDSAFGILLHGMCDDEDERAGIERALGFTPRPLYAAGKPGRRREAVEVLGEEEATFLLSRAGVLLGANHNLRMFRRCDSGPLRQADERGVAEAFERLQSAGVSEADLALCRYRYRCSKGPFSLEAAMAVAKSGRFQRSLAWAVVPRLRRDRELEMIDAGLSELADQGVALEFLDDPALVVWLGPERVATLVEQTTSARTRAVGDTHGPRLERIVARLVEVSDQEAALRVARASSAWDRFSLGRVLRCLPEGKSRQELAAAWLTGRTVEIDRRWAVSRGGADLKELPAGLPAEEWLAVAGLLATEERWGTEKDRARSLLYSLIAAESEDFGLLRELLPEAADQLELLTSAIQATKSWPPVKHAARQVVRQVLAGLAADLAESIEPGELSPRVVGMLALFPPETKKVERGFRRHWPESGSPEHFPTRMAVDVMGEAEVIQRFQEAGSPQPWTLDRLIPGPVWALNEAAAPAAAWALLEPFRESLLDHVRERSLDLPRVLPGVRAAGEVELLKALVALDPQGRHEETRISRAWLEARAGKTGPADRLDVRLLGDGGLQWAVSRLDGGAVLAEGGEIELVVRDGQARRTLWRQAVDEVVGRIDPQVAEADARLEVIHRDHDGRWRSQQVVFSTPVELESKSVCEATGEGPFPGIPSMRARGVVAEAEVSAPVRCGVSFWVRRPSSRSGGFHFEWLDAKGRMLGASYVTEARKATSWTLASAAMPEGTQLGSISRLRLRRDDKALGGLEVSDVRFIQTERIDDEVLCVLPFRPTWLARGESGWWVGGADGNDPIHRAARRLSGRRDYRDSVREGWWARLDPDTGRLGELRRLQAAPVWMNEVAGDVWVMDAEGDLWRYEAGRGFPQPVFAFVHPVQLAVSEGGRWMVAVDDDQQMAVWDLEGESAEPLAKRDGVSCQRHVVVEEGDQAWVVVGTNAPAAQAGQPQRNSWSWFRLSDLEPDESRTGAPACEVRGADGRSDLGGSGRLLKLQGRFGQELVLLDTDGSELEHFGRAAPGCFFLDGDGRVARSDESGRVSISTP